MILTLPGSIQLRLLWRAQQLEKKVATGDQGH
jgi:hypothetical protein